MPRAKSKKSGSMALIFKDMLKELWCFHGREKEKRVTDILFLPK
jgi:hypothetical protein